MLTLESTLAKYLEVCEDDECKQHPYVLKMLQRKDEIEHYEDGSSNNRLYLAGNNFLLTHERLNDSDINVLCKTLVLNYYITALDLRYNNITDIGASYIAIMLRDNVIIKHINLMFSYITEKGAKEIALSLETNQTLTCLRMTGCKIGDVGGIAFAQALQVNETLESLDIGDSDLQITSIVAIATVLRRNRSLKFLNVNRPILPSVMEESSVQFGNVVKMNRCLQKLSLQKHGIRDDGMARICENLAYNSTLTHLDLGCNRITQDGIKELDVLLRLNTGLKVLSLNYNRVQDAGAIYISHALATYNTNLISLSLVSNNIGPEGLCTLAESLRYNGTLTKLYIWGNDTDSESCEALADLLYTDRLESHDVDFRPYIVDGVTYLAQLNHGIQKNYYWAPSYGEDVPSWQPRGDPKDFPQDPGVPLE